MGGGEKVPCTNNITSLTAVMHGLLGSVLSLLLLFMQHNVQGIEKQSITLTADNKEIVKRSKEECIPTNISETWCKEYNLWKLLWNIKQVLPLQVKVEWIKGHQDKLPNGKKVHGPFSRPVELNIHMDKVASNMLCNSTIKAVKRKTYSHNAIGIYQGEEMIMDIERYLYLKVNGQQLQTYIQKKYHWNDLKQSLINWDTIEGAMKSYTEIKKTRMTQIMFD